MNHLLGAAGGFRGKRPRDWQSHHLIYRMDCYISMPKEKAPEHIPLLFIAFPSTKDPTWEDRFPGRVLHPGELGVGEGRTRQQDHGLIPADRSSMTVLVPMAFEWFEEWQEEPKGKRGADYETLKNAFVEASMSVVMKLFPQLEGKVGADFTIMEMKTHPLTFVFSWDQR